ncbi:MAG: hypothetical protein KAQ93_07905 [Spirochaetales bacterium]|nr:hypothetical protein [Spirochaetales bacterium]
MKKKVDLQYIQKHGLRDVEIKETSIDYMEKKVELTLLGFSGPKVLKMEFREITLLEISKVDTFYSPEIILEYLVDERNSVINIYSSSDSVYKIKFGTYSCWIGKAVDFVQGMEKFGCRVDL